MKSPVPEMVYAILPHLFPSSKILDKMQKSLGRVWLCLHEHEVWCNRSKAEEPTSGRAADVHAACALGLYSASFRVVLETPCPLAAAVSQTHSWIMCFHVLSWERNLFCISEPRHSVNPGAVKWGLSAASQLPSSFVLKSEYRLLPFLKLFCGKSFAWYTPV